MNLTSLKRTRTFQVIDTGLAYINDYWHYVTSTIFSADGRCNLEARIIRNYHAIEVSLCYSQQNAERGITTANHLVDLIEKYLLRYNQSRYIEIAIETLSLFLDSREKTLGDGLSLRDLKARIERVKSGLHHLPESSVQEAGSIKLEARRVRAMSSGNFESLLNSRYSVREYKKEPVDQDTVDKAIAMAMRCPTACNRQPSRVYDAKTESARQAILQYQNNSSSWRNDADRLLVVTSDLRCYEGSRERSAAFVDGGLFAMTLVYSLHSLGLGTCCLNLNVRPSVAKELRKALGMSESEVLIMLIASGVMKDHFQVARSARRKNDGVLINV